MRLSKFSMIVMMDMNGGISKNGAPPTIIPSWTKYVKEKTVGNKNNAVIMGRHTFDLLKGKEGPLLPHRDKYVISTQYNQNDQSAPMFAIVYKSLLDCLAGIASSGCRKDYDDVWVLGGDRLFRECVKNFLPYCKKIVVCKINNECFDCDLHFPLNELKKKNIEARIEQKTRDYEILIYEPKIVHQEIQFLKLLTEIIDKGDKVVKEDEEYKVVRNKNLEFDLSEEIPILTTRIIGYQEIINTFVDDMDNMEFCGDTIGFRLRCSKKFAGMKNYASDTNRDQLEDIVPDLTRDSIKTLYTVPLSETKELYVPVYIRLTVSSSKKYLHASVSCNEMEMFKFFPYYLVYISLLVSCIAHFLQITPKNLHFFISEAKVKSTYNEFARKQCNSDPKPLATLYLKNLSNVRDLSDIKKENIEVRNYGSWGKVFSEKMIV